MSAIAQPFIGNTLRELFPALHQKIHERHLIYFDNAATTQKPRQVIQAMVDYYQQDNANIHRGVHTLANRATTAYETSRQSAQTFLNAASSEEIIFTRGATESINLVAASLGKLILRPGDMILLSEMEHHSNIVPWQLIAQQQHASIQVVPLLSNGELDMDAFQKLLKMRPPRIVAISHVSNSLGTINPVAEIIAAAHTVGALVLIDGAQAAAHLPIDVRQLDCDFYCLSAHKMYGPTGVGVLYGKKKWLDKMPPYMGGGEMIKHVSFIETTYNELPYKFEAGTPNICGVTAFHQAIQFVKQCQSKGLAEYEEKLWQHAARRLREIPEVTLIGMARHRIGVLSFTVRGMHHFDVGQWLDAYGIAVRTGHHCTQPVMNKFGIEGTVRVSFSAYNTLQEIDIFIESLQRIIQKHLP